MTYRVVQVTGDGTESAQVVATNAFQPGAQVNRKKMFIMFNRKYSTDNAKIEFLVKIIHEKKAMSH